MKTVKRLFSILLVVALMFGVMSVTKQTTYAAAARKVKITWSANGGKIGTAKTKTVSYTKGKKIGKLKTTTRTGYTLKGWYTKTSGGTRITASTKATKKATFYAQWTAKQYTLTFDVNGGSMSSKSKKVAYNKAYGALPTPTRSGYIFQGWCTAKSGGKKVSKTTKMAAKNVTVYAQWKKDADIPSIVEVEDITSSVIYTNLPNGGANYATVYWTITLKDVPNRAEPLTVKETTSTNDYIYGSSSTHPQFFNTVESSVTARKTVSYSRKVYCVRYGGKANNASYSITVNGVTKTVALPWRACGIVLDGVSFWETP